MGVVGYLTTFLESHSRRGTFRMDVVTHQLDTILDQGIQYWRLNLWSRHVSMVTRIGPSWLPRNFVVKVLVLVEAVKVGMLGAAAAGLVTSHRSHPQ